MVTLLRCWESDTGAAYVLFLVWEREMGEVNEGIYEGARALCLDIVLSAGRNAERREAMVDGLEWKTKYGSV